MTKNGVKNRLNNSNLSSVKNPIWLILNLRRDKKMFKLVSNYKPTGDQPQAIDYLVKGIEEGKKFQTLLGVTGSGKTFTMANIINKVQKPTLVLAHNKTLARPVIF